MCVCVCVCGCLLSFNYLRLLTFISISFLNSRIGNVRFRFKVMRDFEQFKGVYGPGDWIEISFNTTSDYDNVKELVLPLCMGKKRK